MKENVSGCFFSEHSVNKVEQLLNHKQRGYNASVSWNDCRWLIWIHWATMITFLHQNTLITWQLDIRDMSWIQMCFIYWIKCLLSGKINCIKVILPWCFGSSTGPRCASLHSSARFDVGVLSSALDVSWGNSSWNKDDCWSKTFPTQQTKPNT